LGKEWLANYSVTARVPLSPFANAPHLSFTHGSLRPSYENLTPYPDVINRIGHSLLARALEPPLPPPYPPNPYPGFPKGTPQGEHNLYDSGGPLWWRGLAEAKNEKVVCGWARELKEKLGVRRIIGVSTERLKTNTGTRLTRQGHTPNFEKIVDRCNASIIIIDTGISSAYGGVLSALEVIYTLTPVEGHRDDPLQPPAIRAGEKYIEREEVYAVYQTGRKQLANEVREVTM
jgi:hypothetical protein